METERRGRTLGVLRIAGLIGLAIGALAEAVRVTGVERLWFAPAGGVERLLVTLWIVGLATFGVAFTSMWWLARKLDASEGRRMADELVLFETRQSAVASFVVTYVAAVLLATVPNVVGWDLTGRAVALVVVAVATGSLAAGQVRMGRS